MLEVNVLENPRNMAYSMLEVNVERVIRTLFLELIVIKILTLRIVLQLLRCVPDLDS